MQIEISQSEAALIDEALKEWAEVPMREGLVGSVMSSVLRSMRGGPEQTREELAEESEMKEAKEKVTARERKTLLLRAKIAQALARESEHDLKEGS